MDIKIYESDSEGMSRVYENEKWTVGVKNWKPSSDLNGITELERHNLTDELFVWLQGNCTLVSGEESGQGLKLNALKMKPNQVYNIPSKLWHTAVMEVGTKMILIEDVSTGMENSDIYHLNAEEIEAVCVLVK